MPSEIRPNILVVDDDAALRDALAALLGAEFAVCTAADAEKALEHLRSERVACVLLDLSLPGMDGLQLLEKLRDLDLRIPVIVVSARSTVRSAVQAIRLGAIDYLTKPWVPEELLICVRRAVEHSRLVQRVEAYEAAGRRPVTFDELRTRDPTMQRTLDLARTMAGNDTCVLVCGETGTGKDLLARAIHDNGARQARPFVAVNCAAVPASLAESEFFGHEKGAFTGAVRAKRGRFELANEGTLFLDEIGRMQLDLQSKLLRVLQDGIVDRVGGEVPVRVDVRVIAATNLDLRTEVAGGRFREDLYYRLNVVPLLLPPLRERRCDIELLLQHFLEIFAKRAHSTVVRYSADAMRVLCAYNWPGNVRELEHTVERLVILERGPEIGLDHLPVDMMAADARAGSSGEGDGGVGPLRRAREKFERQYLARALAQTGWNQTRAAALLGINRNTLILKMKQYSLRADAEEPALARSSAPAGASKLASAANGEGERESSR